MQTNDFELNFRAMGGPNRIVLSGLSTSRAREIAELGRLEVLRIEQKYSRYTENSLLARINHAAGLNAVEIDAETQALLQFSGALFEQSNGLFDITSGVLRRAWNFQSGKPPSSEQLESLLQLVGWRYVEFSIADGNACIKLQRPGMEIDFGGFGKEYASDRAAMAMASAGASSGFVDLGGDLRVIGPQSSGEPWMIGIQHPRESAATMASIAVHCGGLTTSGDYERFLEIDGKRFCHVLNPKTGWPVSYWRSITVVAPSAIAAGGFCTVAMLLEREAVAMLRESGLQFLAMNDQGQTFRSK